MLNLVRKILYYLVMNLGYCLNLSLIFITYNIHHTLFIELGVEEDFMFDLLQDSEMFSLIGWEKWMELLMGCEMVSLIE